MTPEAIAAAAAQISNARKTVTKFVDLDASHKPSSLDEAYAVQDALMAGWDDQLIGWKIGATNQAAMDLFAIPEVFIGPMYKSNVYESPAEIDSSDYTHTILEQEYAFRLKTDLPAQATPRTRDEILGALGELIPVFEVLSPRLEAIGPGVGNVLTADFGGNGGLVLGEATTDWTPEELISLPVSFKIDGDVFAEGSGAVVLGDPIESVMFFVNRMGQRGIHLKAGQIISSGAMTGVNKVDVGKTIEADFGKFGTVSARYV